MRRSTSDLYAMSLDTQQRINETASAYCQHVYIRLFRHSFRTIVLKISTPQLIRFRRHQPVTQTTLISAWLAAKRLNQTFSRLAEAVTESLLRRRHSGIAVCVALPDGRGPCPIRCGTSETPERQLYCDLRVQVLPRLRNLIQLLQTQMADVSESISYGDNHDVHDVSSTNELRFYALAILGYSERQISLISERFRNL
ncbi:hypothetical protein LSAT2_001701 [Lamellibrachia satsuma]|nr:hypothetical protein LSAT2_001701 [Lamellibrachia satsuma]